MDAKETDEAAPPKTPREVRKLKRAELIDWLVRFGTPISTSNTNLDKVRRTVLTNELISAIKTKSGRYYCQTAKVDGNKKRPKMLFNSYSKQSSKNSNNNNSNNQNNVSNLQFELQNSQKSQNSENTNNENNKNNENEFDLLDSGFFSKTDENNNNNVACTPETRSARVARELGPNSANIMDLGDLEELGKLEDLGHNDDFKSEENVDENINRPRRALLFNNTNFDRHDEIDYNDNTNNANQSQNQSNSIDFLQLRRTLLSKTAKKSAKMPKKRLQNVFDMSTRAPDFAQDDAYDEEEQQLQQQQQLQMNQIDENLDGMDSNDMKNDKTFDSDASEREREKKREKEKKKREKEREKEREKRARSVQRAQDELLMKRELEKLYEAIEKGIEPRYNQVMLNYQIENSNFYESKAVHNLRRQIMNSISEKSDENYQENEEFWIGNINNNNFDNNNINNASDGSDGTNERNERNEQKQVFNVTILDVNNQDNIDLKDTDYIEIEENIEKWCRHFGQYSDQLHELLQVCNDSNEDFLVAIDKIEANAVLGRFVGDEMLESEFYKIYEGTFAQFERQMHSWTVEVSKYNVTSILSKYDKNMKNVEQMNGNASELASINSMNTSFCNYSASKYKYNLQLETETVLIDCLGTQYHQYRRKCDLLKIKDCRDVMDADDPMDGLEMLQMDEDNDTCDAYDACMERNNVENVLFVTAEVNGWPGVFAIAKKRIDDNEKLFGYFGEEYFGLKRQVNMVRESVANYVSNIQNIVENLV